MKKYIIFTADIHPIGGMQNYVAGKVKYLERNGWKVYVFFSGKKQGTCAITSLNQYVKGGIFELAYPPDYWSMRLRNSILKKMAAEVGNIDGETIIESQSSSDALWGEWLAEKIGAKHFCFICNELFRGERKYYEDYIDFFDFKHRRKEIAGIKNTSMSLLFEGYKQVPVDENYVFVAANDGPVQDVENTKVNEIKLADWNIAYIGRIGKGYVDNILAGVKELSVLHPEKHIQFIFVGDVREKKNTIEAIFANTNVDCIFLGDCVPIPRSLYTKLDVVVAGAGCARCSACEGVKTIVADAANYLANGVLGIDTFDTLYHEDGIRQMSFKEALEKVLHSSFYGEKEIKLKKQLLASEYYDEHFALIKNSAPDQLYYHFPHRLTSLKNYFKAYKFIFHVKYLKFL